MHRNLSPARLSILKYRGLLQRIKIINGINHSNSMTDKFSPVYIKLSFCGV